MGCQSGYLEPHPREIYSKETATLIVYASGRLGLPEPEQWVRFASTYSYGDPVRYHELTEILCTICRNMTEDQQNAVIYDGRDPVARRLAEWWENHQKIDAEREAAEQRLRDETAKLTLAASVLARLSPEERSAVVFAASKV
jgi:hypothetical protein